MTKCIDLRTVGELTGKDCVRTIEVIALLDRVAHLQAMRMTANLADSSNTSPSFSWQVFSVTDRLFNYRRRRRRRCIDGQPFQWIVFTFLQSCLRLQRESHLCSSACHRCYPTLFSTVSMHSKDLSARRKEARNNSFTLYSMRCDACIVQERDLFKYG